MLNIVINLERSADRLSFMAQQFSNAGLNFERIKACDASEIPDDHPARSVTFNRVRQLDAATIACFESHRKAWRMIAESAAEFGCVFEDDIVFGNHADLFLRDHFWVPDNARLVKLETFKRDTIWQSTALAKIGPYDLNVLEHEHLGGGAYVIRRDFAAELLNQSSVIRMPVDHFLFGRQLMRERREQVLQAIPAPFMQTFLLHDPQLLLESTIKTERDRAGAHGLTRFLLRQNKSVRKRLLRATRPVMRLARRKVGKIPFLTQANVLA